jgi:hypothetical protein
MSAAAALWQAGHAGGACHPQSPTGLARVMAPEAVSLASQRVRVQDLRSPAIPLATAGHDDGESIRQHEVEPAILVVLRTLHRELTLFCHEMENDLIADVMASDGNDQSLNLHLISS